MFQKIQMQTTTKKTINLHHVIRCILQRYSNNKTYSIATHSISSVQVEQISIDLSPAFISGAKEHFPQANITFDRFHVKKLLNVAMNDVRALRNTSR